MPLDLYAFDFDISAPLTIVGTTGVVTFFGGKELFLKGYPRYRQDTSCDAYVSGNYSGSASGYAALYIQGGYTLTNSCNAYIAGYEAMSGFMPLSVEGAVWNATSGIPLYMNAPESLMSFIPLAVSGQSGYSIGNCVLFISGPVDSVNASINLFARGI